MCPNSNLAGSRLTGWRSGRRGSSPTQGSPSSMINHTHSVHIYKEYHSVCPLVVIGTLPPPLPPASVPLSPEPKGGGGTLACGWGVGGVPILTTGEKAQHSSYSLIRPNHVATIQEVSVFWRVLFFSSVMDPHWIQCGSGSWSDLLKSWICPWKYPWK